MLHGIGDNALTILALEGKGMYHHGIQVAQRVGHRCRMALLISLPETILDPCGKVLIGRHDL
jgi:hypothetical protein